MTEALFIAATLMLACAIMATLYGIVRNAPAQPTQQSYRLHRPWNFN